MKSFTYDHNASLISKLSSFYYIETFILQIFHNEHKKIFSQNYNQL